jgi:hypothetical protein
MDTKYKLGILALIVIVLAIIAKITSTVVRDSSN